MCQLINISSIYIKLLIGLRATAQVDRVIVALQWPPMNGTVKHAHKARRSLTTWEIDPKALNKNSFHTVHELTQVVD